MQDNNCIDASPNIVLDGPDIEAINRARRWLMGAARILADASNGDAAIDRIAREASTLAAVTEIVLAELKSQPEEL